MANAAPVDEDGKRVFITLEAETPVMVGETLTLGVKTAILPGWHTYWLNAGDSGTAMQIALDMPDGFEMASARWPVPEVVPYDPLVNYGYHGTPVIMQDVRVPDTVSGDTVTIEGSFDVLVCDDICIPESHSASITLPVAETASLNPDFAAYRAALPAIQDWPAVMDNVDGNLQVQVTSPTGWSGFEAARFFPLEWGLIEYPAPQNVAIQGDTLTLSIKGGSRDAEAVGETMFVLKGDGASYELTARAGTLAAPLLAAAGPVSADALPSLMVLILFAFLGGLILNLMPCVFPVLSIKALSIASHGANKRAGLLYTAGAVLCFIALGGVMLALRAGGAQIGWGFQLQSPPVIMGLAWLFFVIGLSFYGAFEVGRGLSNTGNQLTQGNGALAQFMTGVLAVIVATPCTAPFMAASVGASLILPPVQVVAIFAALGLGLAFPILFITLIPAAGRILPKPGAWMERFKQFLAFPMWASAAWLVWVLARQNGADMLIPALGGMLAIAFAIWLKKTWFAVLTGLVLVAYLLMPKADDDRASLSIEPFTPAIYEQAVSDDRPLFVEMTADWCITCKVNERVALQRAETIAIFETQNIRFLRGDWTNRGEDITNYLSRYGRAGVPLYVYYPKGGEEPVLLPQILTPGIVKDHLTKTEDHT